MLVLVEDSSVVVVWDCDVDQVEELKRVAKFIVDEVLLSCAAVGVVSTTRTDDRVEELELDTDEENPIDVDEVALERLVLELERDVVVLKAIEDDVTLEASILELERDTVVLTAIDDDVDEVALEPVLERDVAVLTAVEDNVTVEASILEVERDIALEGLIL